MSELIIFVLLTILSITSSNRIISAISTFLLLGICFSVVFVNFFANACAAKYLPLSFCGDLHGLIDEFIYSLGLGAIASGVTTLLTFRKRK